jgi:hypothetical protein
MCVVGGCSSHGRQEAKREREELGIRYSSKGHCPSDLFPLAGLYLLRFPEPLKVALAGGDQHMSLWERFHILTTILDIITCSLKLFYKELCGHLIYTRGLLARLIM